MVAGHLENKLSVQGNSLIEQIKNIIISSQYNSLKTIIANYPHPGIRAFLEEYFEICI